MNHVLLVRVSLVHVLLVPVLLVLVLLVRPRFASPRFTSPVQSSPVLRIQYALVFKNPHADRNMDENLVVRLQAASDSIRQWSSHWIETIKEITQLESLLRQLQNKWELNR